MGLRLREDFPGVLKNLGLVWAREARHLLYLGLWPFASFLSLGTRRLSSDQCL